MTMYWIGEDICKWDDQWGINIQCIYTAYTTQYQKTKQPD